MSKRGIGISGLGAAAGWCLMCGAASAAGSSALQVSARPELAPALSMMALGLAGGLGMVGLIFSGTLFDRLKDLEKGQG